MKIIPIWFHQKSQSYPQRSFSNDFISQIHMSQTISARAAAGALQAGAGGGGALPRAAARALLSEIGRAHV